MTKIRIVVMLLVVAVLVWQVHPLATLAWSLYRAAGSAGCEERRLLTQAPSPDGSWVAAIHYNVCSDGLFVTTVTDTVEITRPNEAPTLLPSAGTVFGMDDLTSDTPKPLALAWTDKRELEITIPNDAWAGLQETRYADVTISYRYVPDDPIERTCLKRWRSLPSEETVRRSSLPAENISVFLAHCRIESGSR